MESHRKIRITAQSLAALAAFSGLPEAAREKIAKQIYGRTYLANEYIIRATDCGRGVYFVLSGTVKITSYVGRGRQVSFREMKSGEMFGEFAALDGGVRSAEVIAQQPAIVASMSDGNFLALLSEYPTVAHHVLLRMTALARLLTNRVIELSTLGVNTRIHAELVRLARATGQHGNCVTIERMPTRDEFAARISTHREAISHEFSRLIDAGLICKGKNRVVTILDVAALEKTVHDVTNGETQSLPAAIEVQMKRTSRRVAAQHRRELVGGDLKMH